MRRPWISLMLAIAALPVRGYGQAPDDGTVPLPPFIVEEATKGPPWRYAQIPGFEILSRCQDSASRRLSEAHYRLHALLGLLVPETLQLTFAAPRVIIYYDEDLQSASSKEVMSAMVKAHERNQPPPVTVEMPGRFGRNIPLQVNVAARYNFLPNLRLTDKDAMTVFALVREGAYDSDHLVLTRDYLSYLLFERTPTLPAWYAAGVLGLYDNLEFEVARLNFKPLIWISPTETDALRKPPGAAQVLRPLAEFLNTPAPARGAPEAGAALARWRAQATLLVRWALDGRTPAQRAAFFDFVARATFESVTDVLFQQGFGVDLATADAQLAAYLPVAVKRSMALKPERAIKVPKVELRNATDLEVSRLKGDWERLEVAFVRKRSPELAQKYLDQARRTLLRAYDRGDRDAGLLANLGLCECDAGDDALARQYLEDAARHGALRPRANYELGRLRFAEGERNPEGADGRLGTTQMAQVLTPLFAARAAAPAMPEVYELIAQAWSRSAVRPTRGHLAGVDEGVRLFPRRLELVYRVARLHAERGDTEDAGSLVTLGLHLAADGADRDRFTQLQAKLAAAPPPAPPTAPPTAPN